MLVGAVASLRLGRLRKIIRLGGEKGQNNGVN